MGYDIVCKSAFRAVCQQGDAVYFFSGHEVYRHGENSGSHLAETEKELGLQ